MTRPAQRASLRSAAAAAAAALLLGACAGSGDALPAGAGVPTPADQASVDTLGRELFELLDRLADYQAARDRPPRSLREMGLDSLTPRTVRRLARDRAGSGVVSVVVAWRRPDGRAVLACRGDRQVLEDAAMQEGRFGVVCTRADGSDEAFVVSPPERRRPGP
jgi:hypothetical protein